MAMDSLLANIGEIHKESLTTRSDMKIQLDSLHDNLSADMKKDLISLREDVNEKLDKIGADVKELKDLCQTWKSGLQRRKKRYLRLSITKLKSKPSWLI